MKLSLSCLCIALFFSFSSAAFGQETAERLNALESSIKNQAEIIKEQQITIDALKGESGPQKGQELQEKSLGDPSISGKVSGFFGGSVLSNPNLSLVLDTFAHVSNLEDSELENRGIPGFTTHGLEQRKGFNVREAEFFIFSPVDPYFNLYANLPIDDNGMHLEEVYAVTTSLPEGLQMKGGRFKSNFSRLDAQHPHAWDFFDIALPYRAFLGDEGLGGENGLQLLWLPPLPFYTQFGAEVLQGGNDLLFGRDAGSGPHAFSFFVKSSFEPTENSTLYLGPSLLFGKTKNSNIVADTEFDGRSALYGMEAVWKWKPGPREGLTLQSEYLFLSQHGDLVGGDALKRHQDGFYLQGLYQSGRWRFGVRYDMLELFSDSFKLAGVEQDLGATPWRVTGAVELNLSEFTRIRLQYNHDVSGRDGRSNDQGILQFLFGIGAHAAHNF